MEYETRDIKDYGRSLKLFDDLNGVEGVFPESIPADAGDVSFN